MPAFGGMTGRVYYKAWRVPTCTAAKLAWVL